jgi:hypothetical protein
VAPALALTAYWSAYPTGLMRECGHPLLVAIIGVTCAGCAGSGQGGQGALLHRWMPWSQLPETFLMLWLTTLMNPVPAGSALGLLDPLYLTLNVLALLAAAWVLTSARPTRAMAG